MIRFKNLSESEIDIDFKKSIKIIRYLKYQHIVLFKLNHYCKVCYRETILHVY